MSKYNEARQDKQRRSRPWEPIGREKQGMTVARVQYSEALRPLGHWTTFIRIGTSKGITNSTPWSDH